MDLKIRPVEKVGFVGQCMASPSSYASSMRGGYSTPSPVSVAQYAIQQLEAARVKDVEAHERNIPALEVNKAVCAHVAGVMESIGMPKRYSVKDINSRARYPKTVTHDAGYLSDLLREVRTNDGFEHATTCYERMRKEYDAYAHRAAAEAEAAKNAKAREQQAMLEKRKADMELAAILLRYGLPIESTWSDVLDALAGKHQRIALAIAMQQTRMDWNEGAWRVRDAIGSFQIETTEDKDIANDVLACLENFDDGRVFRDTTWSYDALFASVTEPNLSADAQLALQRTSD